MILAQVWAQIENCHDNEEEKQEENDTVTHQTTINQNPFPFGSSIQFSHELGLTTMGHKVNGEDEFEMKPDPASWSELTEKIFIDLMVTEVRRGNRPLTTFTKKGWKHIEKGFYEKTNRRYSSSQMRNKFNQLRIRYQDFYNLMKKPGFSWDPSRNIVTATDEVWKSYRKANKNMGRFRKKGCPLFNEMAIVFQENCQAYFETANCPLYAEERVNIEDESTNVSLSASPNNTNDSKYYRSMDAGCSLQKSPTPERNIQEKRDIGMTVMDKATLEQTEICVPSATSDEKWIESTFMRVPTTMNVQVNPHVGGFSITNCVKCLESIEGVDSNIYLKGIKMFKDPDWREMFMAMSAQRKLDWLTSLK